MKKLIFIYMYRNFDDFERSLNLKKSIFLNVINIIANIVVHTGSANTNHAYVRSVEI